MRRTAFIVEGQTEQIFLLKFLEQMVALQPYHLVLQNLRGGALVTITERGVPEASATHYIRIINVENDDKVLSFIEENLKTLKAKGFQAIYGLRDRYTGDSNKRPSNSNLIDRRTAFLQDEYKIPVEVTVAIEEVEAWFLLVPHFFQAYDASLTLDKISEILDADLPVSNIESLSHPSAVISRVLRSVGLDYKKRLGDSHKISEILDYETLYLEKAPIVPALGRLVNQLSSALD